VYANMQSGSILPTESKPAEAVAAKTSGKSVEELTGSYHKVMMIYAASYFACLLTLEEL
jgi:hypothetical protein